MRSVDRKVLAKDFNEIFLDYLPIIYPAFYLLNTIFKEKNQDFS